MQKLNRKRTKIFLILGLLLCLAGLVSGGCSFFRMREALRTQSEMQGETNLEKVSRDMQRTLDNSKTTLLRFAADVEVYMALKTDTDTLSTYLKAQSNIFRDQSEGTLTNAYICIDDLVILSDSPLPVGYEVTERGWYADTVKSGIDNIHISAPYLDAFTGEMCFTASLLLSDNKTVIGLDYNLSKIQKTVAQMNRQEDGEALIVSRNGVIVGYTDSEYQGRPLKEALPEYMVIYDKLLEGVDDSALLDITLGGDRCTAFCNRSGDWLFIYTLNNSKLYSNTTRVLLLNLIPKFIIFAGLIFLLLYFRDVHNAQAAEKANAEKAAADEKSMETQEINEATGNMQRFTKKSRNGIMAIMILTLTVAVTFTAVVLINWGNDRMERNVDSYNYQLERWMNTQVQTLNMFVDTIAANPSVLDEYQYAVDYLDRIVRNYPEISAAYIARPGNEHEMTMNNGWVPNSDYIVAERQWYLKTDSSPTGMSISSPYLDARTGLYCVTFSRIVNDSITGERIGIFALDFYIENLTSIMLESYSNDGYAFLVDNSDLIVNHPNEKYQIASDSSTNISTTEYRGITDDSAIHFISDYDGKLKVCISRTESTTGFSVIAVKDLDSVYGMVFLVGLTFIVLLITCVVLLYRLILHMMKWQEKSRLALLEEAERASRADHAKSSFLAQMSHEIRTPINAVLGMNEMILRESKEENTLSYASNAYNAGNALLSIINDILDISKIEEGKLEIVETEYSLYNLISDCYHMTANRAAKKSLAFSVQCDKRLPSQLKGDMFHIRQIIVNFLTNAIKYTDDGSVELTVYGKKDENDGFTLCIAVMDTGIGLKPESIDKLFMSFQRFDLERNQSVEGTGLGLAITKQLAELMGGSVDVQSVYGEGSTFTCRIPQQIVSTEPIGDLHLERRRDAISFEKQRFTAPTANILVVDDVEMNVFVFSNFLKEHKMNIDSALSGKQCLKLAAEHKYDVIFMDHMMPEMDGIETFDRLRAEKLIDESTPVVMLTANAISGEEEKYLSKGFASYLTKPIQSDKLDKILLQYLPEDKVVWSEAEAKEAPLIVEQPPESGALLDMSAGLTYNGNSKDTYLKLLKMYVKTGAEKLPLIRELAGSEQWKDYTTEVHALKSTSLMIGSKQLSEAAKEMEMAGKNGDHDLIREKNGDVLAMYEKVLTLGRELLEKEGESVEEPQPEQDVGELAAISPEKLREYIDAVLTACGEFDDDAVVKVCDEASGCAFNGKPLKALFGGVREAADNFDYDTAAEKANAIAEELKL